MRAKGKLRASCQCVKYNVLSLNQRGLRSSDLQNFTQKLQRSGIAGTQLITYVYPISFTNQSAHHLTVLPPLPPPYFLVPTEDDDAGRGCLVSRSSEGATVTKHTGIKYRSNKQINRIHLPEYPLHSRNDQLVQQPEHCTCPMRAH